MGLERVTQRAFESKQRKVLGGLLKELAPTIGKIPWADGRVTVIRRETEALLSDPGHVPSAQAIKVLSTMVGIAGGWERAQRIRETVSRMLGLLQESGVDFHPAVVRLLNNYRAKLDEDIEWNPGRSVVEQLKAYGRTAGISFDEVGEG